MHLKFTSELAVIVLSIVLLTGLALVPAIQIGVNGQLQQQPSQQNQVGISQVIKQIAQQVANANPGTNATQVQQILVQLAKQTAQTASQEQAIQEIQQISSQITKFPYGTVSQSLAHFAGQLVSASNSGTTTGTGTTNNVIQIAQQISQEKVSTGGNVSQSVVNKAIQTATGANSNNINQHIRQTAQIIAKQTGVPVEKAEAIIIQIALQIAQAQGKAITGQYIFQIANEIANNPNGIFTQVILQLAKQDTNDGGKSDRTIKVIKTVVKGDEDEDEGSSIKKDDIGDSRNWVEGLKDIDRRINRLAQEISKKTGVPAEAARKAIVEFLGPTTNRVGVYQTQKALPALEADVATNPNTLNKIANLAKLHGSGYSPVASQISGTLADKLSTGVDPKTALAETAVPDPASVAATGGASPLAGETTTAAGASPLAGETTENDGELADDDAEDEDEPSIEDDAGDDDESDSEDDGATADDEAVASDESEEGGGGDGDGDGGDGDGGDGDGGDGDGGDGDGGDGDGGDGDGGDGDGGDGDGGDGGE